MKYLGIDFGMKRIGLAVSDEAGEFAFPKAIVANDAKAIEEIARIVKEEAVVEVVIGESLATNEKENDVQSAASSFAKRLAAATGLPLHFQREDFSSVEAHRYQTDAGRRDDSAAAIILQRFLDKKAK